MEKLKEFVSLYFGCCSAVKWAVYIPPSPPPPTPKRKIREKNSLEVRGGYIQAKAGIRKAVRHARMAHKATKWPIKKILTGPVMRPDRTKLVK